MSGAAGLYAWHHCAQQMPSPTDVIVIHTDASETPPAPATMLPSAQQHTTEKASPVAQVALPAPAAISSASTTLHPPTPPHQPRYVTRSVAQGAVRRQQEQMATDLLKHRQQQQQQQQGGAHPAFTFTHHPHAAAGSNMPLQPGAFPTLVHPAAAQQEQSGWTSAALYQASRAVAAAADAPSQPAAEQKAKKARNAQQQPPAPKRRKNAANTTTAAAAKTTAQRTVRGRATQRTKQQQQKADASCDDRDGHYIVVPGREFTPRFKIRRLLGQGTFGKVMECEDGAAGRLVAIKVIRAVPKYRDAAKIEIRVLQTLQRADPANAYQCMHVNETFDHRNHVCMVFDLLGPSVFDFLKENEFRPFSLHHVQLFAEQLLRSVAFLHSLNLVHTDLKPENILLESGEFDVVPFGNSPSVKTRMLRSTKIRLIDFGSATFNNEYHSQVVSTRHYRAPEIILNLGWSFACDMWSIGCIILELLTGEALFQTHDNNEHLAMMEVVVGRAPTHVVRSVSQDLRAKFFRSDCSARYPVPEQPRQSQRGLRAMRPLSQLVNPVTNPIYANLHDLLFRLLQYDPHARISAKEACEHPFFRYRVGANGRLVPRPSPTPQHQQQQAPVQLSRQPEPLVASSDLVPSPSIASHRSFRPSYPSVVPPQQPVPAAVALPPNPYTYGSTGSAARAPLRVGDYSLAGAGPGAISPQQPQALPALKTAIPGNYYREQPVHQTGVATPHSPYAKQDFGAQPAPYYQYQAQHSRAAVDSSYPWYYSNGLAAHAQYAGHDVAKRAPTRQLPPQQQQQQQQPVSAGVSKRKAGVDSGYFPDLTVPADYGYPEDVGQSSPAAAHAPGDSRLHVGVGARNGYPASSGAAPPPASTAPAGCGATKGGYNLPPISAHAFRQPPMNVSGQHYQSRHHPYGYAGGAGHPSAGVPARLVPIDANTTPTLTSGATETATPTPGSSSGHLRSSHGMEGGGGGLATIGTHKAAGRSLPALVGGSTPAGVSGGEFARASLAEPAAAHHYHHHHHQPQSDPYHRGLPLPQTAQKYQLPSASPMLQQVPTRSGYYHHGHHQALPPAQTLLQQQQAHTGPLGYAHSVHFHPIAPHPSANNSGY